MVYLQSAVYLTRRVDGILRTEAGALASLPSQVLPGRINEALTLNGPQTNIFALFGVRGEWISGNLRRLPAAVRPDGAPIEIPPTSSFPANARLIALRLRTGQILVVGRDVNQLQQMRAIIASALMWSGFLILLVGLACGVALSARPLRRLRDLQAAGHAIASGDLKQRMPTSSRHDELDLLASTVNYMMDQVERLMVEVKGVSETIAHDLRTPLTRARAQLHRFQTADRHDPEVIAKVITEIDEVLDRFRALMRISELEALERHAGVTATDLVDIVERVAELYQPLAESGGVRLSVETPVRSVVEADPKLLFEAISNLVDNAIKFTGAGGGVKLGLRQAPEGPQIVVQDNGPGIPVGERSAVLQRFYRSERNRLAPGSGLGLSIVAAIVRLHGFELVLEEAAPGLRAVINCKNAAIKP
jgi:signal transduction histidine kinase